MRLTKYQPLTRPPQPALRRTRPGGKVGIPHRPGPNPERDGGRRADRRADPGDAAEPRHHPRAAGQESSLRSTTTISAECPVNNPLTLARQDLGGRCHLRDRIEQRPGSRRLRDPLASTPAWTGRNSSASTTSHTPPSTGYQTSAPPPPAHPTGPAKPAVPARCPPDSAQQWLPGLRGEQTRGERVREPLPAMPGPRTRTCCLPAPGTRPAHQRPAAPDPAAIFACLRRSCQNIEYTVDKTADRPRVIQRPASRAAAIRYLIREISI
jgi:hypothetical protein